MVHNWMFYYFSQPDLQADHTRAESTQAVYDRYLDLCVRDERLGFEGVFFSEHHFSPLNLSPSPNLMVAAAAQLTKTLRLGVMGNVLPLHDPRRLAEECGMLDYITRGRLEIGLGPGVGGEPVKAGLDPEEIRPRYASGAEVIGKYLRNHRVTHDDDFTKLDDVPIIPAMRQSAPSVWVTAMSESSAAWAATSGFKVCTAWLPTDQVADLCRTYHVAADEAGVGTQAAGFGIRRRVFVAPTDTEALELAEAAFDPVALAIQGGASGPAQATALEASDSHVMKMFMNPDDIIIGSPETVTERLVEQVRTIGADHVMYFSDFKMFDPADLVRCHELIGERVAPVLRSTTVDAPTTATVG